MDRNADIMDKNKKRNEMRNRIDKILGEVIRKEKSECNAIDELCDLFSVRYSAEDVIKYIENDAEIAIPIDRFFDALGNHITKKEYGKILLEILCKELREHYT